MKTSKAVFTAKDLESNLHFACKAKPVNKACSWSHVEKNRGSK